MAYNVNPEQQVILADIVTVVLPAYRLRSWPRLYIEYTRCNRVIKNWYLQPRNHSVLGDRGIIIILCASSEVACAATAVTVT